MKVLFLKKKKPEVPLPGLYQGAQGGVALSGRSPPGGRSCWRDRKAVIPPSSPPSSPPPSFPASVEIMFGGTPGGKLLHVSNPAEAQKLQEGGCQGENVPPHVIPPSPVPPPASQLQQGQASWVNVFLCWAESCHSHA